jgi:hypothetical protein
VKDRILSKMGMTLEGGDAAAAPASEPKAARPAPHKAAKKHRH